MILTLSRTIAFLFVVLLAGTTAGEARALYDEATLARWQERHQRTTQRIFDEVVLPALTVAEEGQLGRVPPIDFPMRPLGDWSRYPLAFYVPHHRRAITMPISSLKFLDDLCIAYAWLQINGYAIETVSEYTAILRYGTPPAGGFPPPLEALGIPEDALDDPRVDELSLGHFVTARTFLLAHELAHILYDHRAASYAEARRNEAEADQFAFRLMRRTPLPPKGALLFFMADAHWGFMDNHPEAKHPMAGARVTSAADLVDDPAFAMQLRRLGEFLDDPEIRQGFIATGKAGDLAALAPRRPGTLARRPGGTGPSDGDAAAAFDGRYTGHFTQHGSDRIPVEVVFERHGDRVSGWYNFGLGLGRITGRVNGDRLVFDWEWADNTGRGILHARSPGAFEGTWGYRNARDGAGTWNGRR